MSDQSQTPTTPKPEGLAGGVPQELIDAGKAPEALKPDEPPKVEPPKPEEKKPEEKAPEVVALALKDVKLPEGFTLDEKTFGDFSKFLTDPALTPQQRAQGLIDMQIAREKAISEQGTQAFTDLQNTWREQVKNDPEIGGAKYDATVAGIGKLMEKYADEPTRQVFETTGAGNNPLIVKMFAKMAKDLAEGGPVPGDPGASAQSLASKIYTKGM